LNCPPAKPAMNKCIVWHLNNSRQVIERWLSIQVFRYNPFGYLKKRRGYELNLEPTGGR